jgi:GYF domain 2
MTDSKRTSTTSEPAGNRAPIEVWYYEDQGRQCGPMDEEALKRLLATGALSPDTLVWSKVVGGPWRAIRETDLFDGPPALPARSGAQATDEVLIRRLADFERVSGIVWIVLGALQIALIYTAIAGVWNIIAGILRLTKVKMIKGRSRYIPQEYEPIRGLVVIAIVNLLLGGLIGLVFVAFDFYIRDKVLANRHLFNRNGAGPVLSGDIPLGRRANG